MAYSLPCNLYKLLEERLGNEKDARVLGEAIEAAITTIQEEARNQINERKNETKALLKEDLRNELVTRDIFEERFKVINERFNVIDERFKKIDFQFKVLIGVMVFGFTLFNPAFLDLLKTIFA